MKKTFLFSIFLSGILLLVPVFNAAQVIGPKASFTEKKFDFGKVEQGEVVTHDFEIYNTGDAPLKIFYVRSSCGCTAAKPANDTIPPGGKTSIHVKFNSGHYKGHQRKYVYVITNDPKNREIRFALTGIVLEKDYKNVVGPRLVLSKTHYNFGTVEKGKTVSTEISFSNKGNKVLKIREVETSCGCTAVLLSTKELNPGQKGKMRIDLDTSNHLGNIVRKITIFSNDPVKSKQVITIFAYIK